MHLYLLILLMGSLFAGELEVEGDLKITGNIDANGNAITNVGEPVFTTDVATANYVNSRTAGKGRIITLKCAWYYCNTTGTCDPPTCPDGWNDLAISNETSGIAINSGNTIYITGNSIRYCIEQEDEE